jgi:hypothetical protein
MSNVTLMGCESICSFFFLVADQHAPEGLAAHVRVYKITDSAKIFRRKNDSQRCSQLGIIRIQNLLFSEA